MISGGHRARANLTLVADGSGLDRRQGVPALSFESLTPLCDVLGYGVSFTAKILDATTMGGCLLLGASADTADRQSGGQAK